MKKYIIFLIALFAIEVNAEAQLRGKVDEGFELLSIAFRLAGAQEFSNSSMPGYSADIDSYFFDYKGHPLISYIKDIRNEYGVAYDAVSTAAACLSVENNEVSTKSGVDISALNSIDSRWTEETFAELIRYLNSFYRETDFHTFFTDHEPSYSIAEERMKMVLDDLNFEWFDSFLDYRMSNPQVVISLTNGPGNYAFNIPDMGNGIVIGAGSDSAGQPYFNKNMQYIVVHELLHEYANAKIAELWPEIENSSDIIYSYVKDKMRRNAYGDPKTSMTEWLINLLTVMYYKDNRTVDLTPAQMISSYEMRGFVWMQRSVYFLFNYTEYRDYYPTFKDFTPSLVEFINSTAANFEKILNEYDKKFPEVVEFSTVNGSTISDKLEYLTIEFSHPMSSSHGLTKLEDVSIIPIKSMPYWSTDTELTIPLDTSVFEDNATYGFEFNMSAIMSKNGYPMKENTRYTFTYVEP